MRFLKKLFILVVVLVLIAVGASFLLPSRYHVERSVSVNARPEALHALVADLRRWEEWTAWNKDMDPTLHRTFSGAEKGAGAQMTWKGEKSGQGLFTISSADPAKGITYDLDFENGRYKSTGAIRFEAADAATKVTWTNEGDAGANPVKRYFNLLMDKMMGPDFQKGLDRLKALAEGGK